MAADVLITIPNYRGISKRLATGGQPDRQQLEAAAAAGFKVIINLGVPSSPYALPDEAAIVKELGLEYVAIPVDWEAPTRAHLDTFFEAMHATAGRRVFVHCARNMRVSVFTALHQVAARAWSPDEARDFVLSIWQPNETWSAFFDDELAQTADQAVPLGVAERADPGDRLS